jgi:hypothetical protein
MPETSQQKETELPVMKSPSMVPAIRFALIFSFLFPVSDFISLALSLSVPVPVSALGEIRAQSDNVLFQCS